MKNLDAFNSTRRNWTLLAGLSLAVAACTASSSSSSDGDGGSRSNGDAGAGADSGYTGHSGSPGASGSSHASGSGAGPSSAGESGSPGEAGSIGAAGAAGGDDDTPQLPDGALLYIRHETKDHDLIVAHDFRTGDERIVTDLTGDGSSGWEIDGFALSPDRRRIAIASLYGPTKEDTATGLATRAIWTLAVDGSDFRRLTPTFPKDAQGRQGFQYDIGYPEWTADGAQIVYDFGQYWWEGATFKGGSFPWIVSAAGKVPPSSFPTPSDCTVLYPSRNPASGEFLFIHSVCVPGQGEGEGLYLYPASGGKNPQKLVDSSHGDGGVDVFLAKPSWFSDGSGFLFLGGTADTDWRPSLLACDLTNNTISMLVPAPVGTGIQRVAVSADTSKIVYCLSRDDGREDLHLIDLSLTSPTDVELTTDGKSCHPSF